MSNVAVVTQGDVFSLRFPLLDQNGAPATYVGTPSIKFDLSGYSIFRPGDIPVLTKSSPSSGCRAVQESTTWVAYVDFASVDTLNNASVLAGRHYYEVKANANTVASGVLTIRPTLITS